MKVRPGAPLGSSPGGLLQTSVETVYYVKSHTQCRSPRIPESVYVRDSGFCQHRAITVQAASGGTFSNSSLSASPQGASFPSRVFLFLYGAKARDHK